METLKNIINLLRVRQWYKNLLVFLPIFFSGYLFDVHLLVLTVLGFLTLCLISSGGYIFNDLIDYKRDQLNPEKANRPIAAGKISRFLAILIFAILSLCTLIIAFFLDYYFLILVILILILGLVYTLWLKKILFADILTISTLFVIRAISGAFIINVKISPWLVLCPFFLSLFLSVGKRHSEIKFLKEKANMARSVLKDYTLELTSSLMIISTTLLIISYALYSFLSEHNYLLITLPFALFVVFRFFYFISNNFDIARHPERIIKDRQILIGILCWIATLTFLIYWR